MENRETPPEGHLTQALIEMKSKSQHQEGGDELWAVSYADLLMVLMSFFIVFFNMDDVEQMKIGSLDKLVSILQNDLYAIRKDPETQLPVDEKVPPLDKTYLMDGFGKKVEKKVLERSPAQLNQLSFTLDKAGKGEGTKDGDDLVIDFSHNLFPSGQYELSSSMKKEIDRILEKIKPLEKDLHLIFIGHADQQPIGVSKKRGVIKTNLILSSLRAAKAVEYALSKGWSPNRVSSQGMGEYFRQTRSLSMRVVAR